MKPFTERFYSAMENQLSDITLSGEPLTEQYRLSILVCKKAMTKLKNYVSSYAFESVEEEISFFKQIKPQFYSKYIYYVNIYRYLTQRPLGGEDALRDYINNKLTELQQFFDGNKAFYQYYRSGGTQMDTSYFTRGGFEVQMELDDFEEDEQYSTSHGYKISKLMANDKLQDFYQLELARIGNEEVTSIGGKKIFPFDHPKWTASPTDAAELLHALQGASAINNGHIDIKELVAIWEFVFQMKIKEPYHKLYDIGKRHDPFVFLKRLQDGLWKLIKKKLNKGLPPDQE
jgi:hypothetical protein